MNTAAQSGALASLAKTIGVSPDTLVNLLGNGVSGWMGSNAAQTAADQQLQAGRESNALIKSMYDQQRADLAPYREAGTDALGQIKALLADPSSLTSTPGYQFGLDQGVQARDRGAAAKSGLYSGAQGKALTQFGNDYGTTKLDQSYNRLANLAGLGQVGATGSANAAGNYGTQVGNTLQNMGNVRGAGTIGSNNAWSGAIGNALQNYNMQQYLPYLIPGGRGG